MSDLLLPTLAELCAPSVVCRLCYRVDQMMCPGCLLLGVIGVPLVLVRSDCGNQDEHLIIVSGYVLDGICPSDA